MKKYTKDIRDIIIIVLMVVFIRTIFVTPARVSGDSMNATLFDKEIVIVNKIDYKLNSLDRFDIAVFQLDDKEKLIKRVIGLPGEKVEYRDNILYINDEEVNSPIDFESTEDFIVEKVELGSFFLMGDNRDDSLDSRALGSIASEKIIGTVQIVLFPFNHFGKVK